MAQEALDGRALKGSIIQDCCNPGLLPGCLWHGLEYTSELVNL